MHALLYRSRARPQLLADGINDIVATAERNNAALGITGLMLYGEMEVLPGAPGSFVQWLEGPQDAVESLFETISGDPRHTAIDVLGRGPSDEMIDVGDGPLLDAQGRLFPLWSMGMVRMSELPATLPGFLRFAREWDGLAVA